MSSRSALGAHPASGPVARADQRQGVTARLLISKSLRNHTRSVVLEGCRP